MSITTKIIAGTIFAGGITVSTIAWNGGTSLDNVKTKLNNMKSEFTAVVSENTFLKTEFGELKGFYNDAVTESNGKIGQLLQERDELQAKVSDLQQQLDTQADTTAEQAEIQGEIDRLEGQIETANAEAAELDAYATTVDDSTQFTAMTTEEKAAFTATEQDIVGVPLQITGEALALNQAKAELLASPETVAFFEQELASTLPPAALVGVTTYTKGSTKYLAYEVAEPFAVTQASLTYEMQQFLTNNGLSYVYFVTSDGAFVANASQWGSVTVEKSGL